MRTSTALLLAAALVPAGALVFHRPLPSVARARVACDAMPPTMNLFSRFGRVAKANLNQLVTNMEDPEKVMTQAVEDLNKDLIKVRQSYAEVMATQKRLEKQKEAADKAVDEWMKRAQLAVQKGDDELAREALARKQSSVEQAESLGEQMGTQQASLDSLYESMSQLESKISEAKSMREQYVARARTAKTATKVNDMLSGMGTETSMQAFDRMKEKVEQLESKAEVSAQLTGSTADLSMESKFKELEGESNVDDELAMMKKQLSGDAAPKAELTSSEAEGKSGGAVDDELAKLKKEMS